MPFRQTVNLLRTVFLLFLLLPLRALWAQEGMQVTHFDASDGLAHNIVYCSLKTSDGFLWFGTWYGLSRFDGLRFDNLSRSFSASSDQPPRKVESIVEDANGNLWVKTLDWKLSLYYKRTEHFEDIFDELKPYTRNLQVIKILSDGQGGVLLLTKDKTLLLAHTNKADGRVMIERVVDARKHINPHNMRLLHPVTQISKGRASYEDDHYHVFSLPIGKKQRSWSLAQWSAYFAKKAAEQEVYRTPGGLVWQLSEDRHALLCTETKTGTVHRYPLTKGTRRIGEARFIATPQHGYFYLSAAGELLHILPHTLQAHNVALLPAFTDFKENSRFLSIQMDRDGLLWITSADNGIYRINFAPNQFRLIPLPGEDRSGVRSLFQMQDGRVLVGTRSKTLYVYSSAGQHLQTLDYASSQIGSVYHMMQDHLGRLWLSTKGDGLVCAVPCAAMSSGYRFEHFRHQADDSTSISGNNVYMTYQDSHRRIWVGTLDGGLNLVSENAAGKVSFYNKYHGMRNYPGYGLYMDVRNMVEDSLGRLWVGTIDGLMSLNVNFRDIRRAKIDIYRRTDVNTPVNSDIYGLYRDSRKNVWICTFGGGLARLSGFDPKEHLPLVQNIGSREGLLNDVILSIIEDRKGRLWLAKADGMSCYDYKTGRVHTYDSSDGFPTVEIEESASLLNRDGRIWLGSKVGILTFHPDSLFQSTQSYPLYILGGEVNNRDIRLLLSEQRSLLPDGDGNILYADRLQLKHSQSMFTLQFAALNYANPERITYRYRLEGYDHDWHYSGALRIASYTNVPPGKYTFRVEAIDATAPDQHASRTLQITILPPWWNTWWANLLYVLAAIAAIYAAVRYARYHIRVKNDIYIQTKLAEYKRRYTMEQEEQLFLERINSIIAEHLTDTEFDIGTISEQLGMSRSSFFKKVKAVTGSSPSDLVKDYKLSQAVELLKHTDSSITDVAYQCGFSDVSYFGKCFRKKFGMSPRAFAQKE